MRRFELEPLFRELDALRAEGPWPSERARVEAVIGCIVRHRPEWQGALEALAAGEKEARSPEDEALERFVLRQAERLARTPADAEPIEGPDGETCPNCGGVADVAYLDPNGTRHAVCAVCDARWAVPRILCLHCGESDPGRLEYYPYEDGYRLYRCKRCGHLLPAVDLREAGTLDLPRLRAAAAEMVHLFEVGAVEE
ncbi:formate dehydrogenase accessory protein FdhE [Oceanithermus sp.]|uniref:formate dehydrogenase accessory protein FdhE domain-containing protein n=1 Tax=Oceanithermus sp. TaxID=2268145 RepID=UPI0025E8C4BF|nr:formate dehydrogenase accessory protein FdhE [Oceanithermus sp.]